MREAAAIPSPDYDDTGEAATRHRRSERQRTMRTAVRMIVYPALAIAFASTLYFDPDVQFYTRYLIEPLEGRWLYAATSAADGVTAIYSEVRFYVGGEMLLVLDSLTGQQIKGEWKKDGDFLVITEIVDGERNVYSFVIIEITPDSMKLRQVEPKDLATGEVMILRRLPRRTAPKSNQR